MSVSIFCVGYALALRDDEGGPEGPVNDGYTGRPPRLLVGAGDTPNIHVLHYSPSLAAAPPLTMCHSSLHCVLFGSVDVCLHQVTPFCTKQKSLGACTFCCCNVSSLVLESMMMTTHTHTSERRRRRRIAILEWKKKTLDMSPSRAWLGKGRGNTHALGHNLPPPLRIPMKEALTLTDFS
jgi:hypothetical protein